MTDSKISTSQLFNITTTILTKPQKRWRLAFLTIYSARTILPLLSKNRRYLALEVEPSSSHSQVNKVVVNSIDVPSVDGRDLTEMVKKKNLQSLHLLGGVEGVAADLGTNPDNGISGNSEDIRGRSQLFGTNTYERPPRKGFLHFVMEGFKDAIILLFLACAALALGFGMKEHGLKEGWHEGGSIFLAVFLVVAVSSLSNLRKEIIFENLSRKINDIKVEVVRDAQRQQVCISELVVGDVVFLKIGDKIPADGLFLNGCSLKVDESSITEVRDHVEVDSRKNPFLFSGSMVVNGYAQMLVVSVGMKTAWGEKLSSISCHSSGRTPLQARLGKLISAIARLGLAVALIPLVYLLVYYFTGKTKDKNGKKEYNGSKTDLDGLFKSVGTIVVAAVTIVVAAIPVGLPFAVTLTLANSMKRLMADRITVRKFSALETMGSATVICTEKIGILTLNQTEVSKFWIGAESIEEESYNRVHSKVRKLFHQAIGLNTTGSGLETVSGSGPEFSGSPTEKAILSWAVLKLGMDMDKVKQRYTVLQIESFNSEKKRRGVSIRKKDGNTIHVHWKGAAEMILAMCSHYYEIDGVTKAMGEDERRKMGNITHSMAASSLSCIAFAHEEIPKEEMMQNENGKTHQRLKKDGLTLLGIVALKDPYRPGVKKEMDIFKLAGVNIKMITVDNVLTAKDVATACGILNFDHQVQSGDQVVEGNAFRHYTDEQIKQKVDQIQVMASSSPSDKLLMVQSLKQKGHVVAVTGNGPNDALALKEADIGLSMGIDGSQIAKESSDIIILGDNFTSVATVTMWGRCVYSNIQKFIQFQLTINMTAVAVSLSRKIPLTTVQLLWMNLIIGPLGALALAADMPTDELMKRRPHGRSDPLITNIMWRNLLISSLYQIGVLLILEFKGAYIFGVSAHVNDTMIFNTFALCQVFNTFNARKLEDKNVFKGFHKNRLFLGIVGITVVVQFLMVEFLKKFASAERLNLGQWVDCIAMAALTWPIGWVGKFIPVPEKPLFVDSNGDFDFGFGKCIKFLFCCLLNLWCPSDCD